MLLLQIKRLSLLESCLYAIRRFRDHFSCSLGIQGLQGVTDSWDQVWDQARIKVEILESTTVGELNIKLCGRFMIGK